MKKLLTVIFAVIFTLNLSAQKQCPGIAVVGYGYDIFGEYANNKSVKEPLFNFTNYQAKPMDDGQEYKIPSLVRLKYVSEKDYKTTEGSSLREYTKSMSVGAGLSIDAMVFSGSIESRFGQEKSGKTSNYFYTITDWTRVWEVYINPVKAKDGLRQYLTADAKTAIDTWSTEDLFDVYGTHFVNSGYFGGAMEFNLSESFSSQSDAKSISVAVQAQYQTVSGNADFSSEKSGRSEEFKKNVKIYARGGDTQYANKSSVGDNSQYNLWVNSIPTKAVLIDFKEGSLTPIWELAGNQTRKNALKAGFNKLLKSHPLPAEMSGAMMVSNQVYFIGSAADNTLNIDIPGYHFNAQRQKGTKISMYPKDNKQAGLQGIDRFIKVIPHATEPDYVFLQPQHSDLVFDIPKGKNGIVLWSMNNNKTNQMFKMLAVDGKKNTYYIQSKSNGLYLTSNGKSKQITLEAVTKAENQQWVFETASFRDMASLPTDIVFAVKNVKAKRYMDLGGSGNSAKKKAGKIQLWDMNKDPDRFSKLLKSNLNGVYYVQQMHSKYVWDMVGGKKVNGTKLNLWDKMNGPQQQFKFVYAGSAMTFYIQNNGSKRYLSAVGSQIDQNGCPIQLWDMQKKESQQWKLEIAAPKYFAPEKAVKAKIKLAYTNKYWDIDGPGSNAKVKGKKLQIWDMDAGIDRTFTIKKSGDKAWIWIELEGGKRIEVNGGSKNIKVKGIGLGTWDPNNNDSQKFAIQPTGRYTFIIKTKGGKALDVSGGKIGENGTRLHLWDIHFGGSQQFQLIDPKTNKPIDFSKY